MPHRRYLEKYRIGSLSPEEARIATSSFEFGDAYEEDPPRHPDCVTCTPKPFCGETRLDLLAESCALHGVVHGSVLWPRFWRC